jgi:putative beta-barrel porin
LGNLGTASRSLLFSPFMKSGFDPGFHSFDIYNWKLEDVEFNTTSKPLTELNYVLGSRTEQIIAFMHTRNIKPNWNVGVKYRIINSPGFYKNQKTNHINYLLSSWYQSPNKRYNNYTVLLANHIQSGENGGIKNDQDYLGNTESYKDRFNIPVKLGGDEPYTSNFFSTEIFTGTRNREFTGVIRQQYDLGRKDSLVTDSTVIPLFYPRLRFEHTIKYDAYKYQFFDLPHSNSSTGLPYYPDSAYYFDNYGLKINNGYAHPDTSGDSVQFRDRWKILSNDFSIYQFPYEKNLLQFIRLGVGIQNIRGEFKNDTSSFFNLVLHGEYRNKTRNKKWDMELAGTFNAAGFNSGDYNLFASLRRFIGQKNIGYTELGFENVNRTPSFLFDSRTSFFLDQPQAFKKENNSHFFATIYHNGLNLGLSGDFYLVTNYTYFENFYKLKQYEPLFNFFRITAQKVFNLGKNFKWHADVYVQQKTGAVPIHVPLLFSRNLIGYEGNLGLKRLHLAAGFEVKYHTPYYADNYSPILAQFFYQDSVKISNAPEVNLYMNMRIRGFRMFFRLENLNSAQFTQAGGFGFTRNNLSAPDYPYPGLQIRLGVWWNLID